MRNRDGIVRHLLKAVEVQIGISQYAIVGIERRFFGHPSATHAVVITAVQSMEGEMLDPLVGPAPQISHIATFAIAWRSAGQEALVLLRPLPG